MASSQLYSNLVPNLIFNFTNSYTPLFNYNLSHQSSLYTAVDSTLVACPLATLCRVYCSLWTLLSNCTAIPHVLSTVDCAVQGGAVKFSTVQYSSVSKGSAKIIC